MRHREVESPARVLRDCFDAAVAAVQPARALDRPLSQEPRPREAPAIIAVGKAAGGMAAALEAWCQSIGQPAARGLIVAPEMIVLPSAAYQCIVGDHPEPGDGSDAAARAIGDFIAALPATTPVHVAISGGASALIAAPLRGLIAADMRSAFRLLIRAGLPIDAMNAVRKRLTRWSAGRLAAALGQRETAAWLISDVIGDRLEDIGSGPCTGDSWRSHDVIALLTREGLWPDLSRPIQHALVAETIKPDDERVRHVRSTIVASNHHARAAAITAAAARGLPAALGSEPLVGDAATAGRTIARAMLAQDQGPTMVCWGGETTVSVGNSRGQGGRSMEFALAAAEALRGLQVTLLAAGTDGRDGPTDAAGAIVDGQTWDRCIAVGGDPAIALREHDSYPMLDRAGALLRTGPTGTNVMDLALALRGSGGQAPA